MKLAGLSPAGALLVRDGEPFGVSIILLDAEGQPQDLSGRIFYLSVRYTDQSTPFLTITSDLASDNLSAFLIGTAEQAAELFQKSQSRALSYDITEATGAIRWFERVETDQGSGVAPTVPIVFPDLPASELRLQAQAIVVTERGATGPGVERRLYEKGLIAAEDTGLMIDKMREWGGEGGAPFAEAADAAAQAAVEARQQAENLVEPVQAIADKGSTAIKGLGVGRDISIATDADLVGVQAVTPLAFMASWVGTAAALLAQVAVNAAVLVDDGPRLQAAIIKAAELGHDLELPRPVYTNTPINWTVNGKRVHLKCSGNGEIIGGPGIDGPLIKIANSSSSGGTSARSVNCKIVGLKTNMQFVPSDPLSSRDHISVSGFNRVTMIGGESFSGQHYSAAGGDSGMFITANRVIVRDWQFYGMIDLAIYLSGSQGGNLDNRNVLLSGNTYTGCKNAWSAKRNYRYVRSSGEHFERCFNGPSAYAAGGTAGTLGQYAGSVVSVVGATFHDMENRCIDPRGSSNWNVTGMIVSGRFGRDNLNAVVPNACIIGIAGSSNNRFEFVADIDTSVWASDPSHAAVRITTYTNTLPNPSVTTISTGNSVKATVKGIYNGLLEFAPCGKNTVELNLTDVANPYTMPNGNGTRLILNNDGARSELVGNFDATPGRTAFGGQVRTASFSISLNAEDRFIQTRPDNALMQAVLPLNAPNGYQIGMVKVPGSGAGPVAFRDPTNSFNIGTPLREVGETIWAVCDGAGGWTPARAYFKRTEGFRNQAWLPAGWVRDSYQRNIGATQSQALTSGRLFLCAFEGLQGDLATTIKFMNGGAASGLTGRFFALYDKDRNLLGVSADDTSSWAPGEILSLPLTTPVRLPYSGLFYVGVCEVAATPASIRGTNGSSNMLGLQPVLVGNSTSGLTNAASAPAIASTIAAVSITPYCGIG